MDREAQRALEILSIIAKGVPVTQRGLARKLGIALGLTNLYLKRLVGKGCIKIAAGPSNRITYLLTHKGFAEKTRLTYEYTDYSLQLYRKTRTTLREALDALARQGCQRVVLYGTGEAAEIAYLTIREVGLELTEVVDRNSQGGTFLGLPVRRLADLPQDGVDAIIVASFTPGDEAVQALTGQGVPRSKIVSLRGA